MSTDEFTKLFVYMEKRFNKIEEALDSKVDKTQFDRVLGLLDALVGRTEFDEHERLAISAQLDRHEERLTSLERRLALR